MKTIFFFAALIFVTSIYSQDEDLPSGFELSVENGSTNNSELRTRVYPVSMVFNGNDPRQYDLHAKNSVLGLYNYINGRNVNQTEFALIPGTSKGWDLDGTNTNAGTAGAVGVGVYKIDFFWNGAWRDSCLVEWDEHNPGDLTLKFLDDSNPRIVYHWADCNTEAALPSDRKLFAYNQTGCGGISRNKEYGNFIYSTANNNTYTVLPQDYRQDCGNENYSIFDGQYGTGRLFSNLTIDKSIQTRIFAVNDYRYEAPTQIVITPNCTLIINNEREFKVLYDPSFNEGLPQNYNKFYVKAIANLQLNPSSKLIFEKTNWLILEKNSNLYLGSNARLNMERGSSFCNYGANIVNNGVISVKGNFCSGLSPFSDVNISGSGTFEVDSTEFYIPDSTTYTFDSNSVFVCKPYTNVIFGKNSKLIFQNGSRIFADNCKFVSYDSTEVWDGIYLDGIAYDTLKNCTFQNAVNGINITDNYDPFGSPGAAEISNCTFKNSTSSDLLNYVYVNNSYNVLIKGCNSEKTGSGGFTSGIIAEYSPTNGVVIADNNINYVTTGISLLQSSEYIGRNTITGSTNSGAGIYLDNSNGTIEYNTVNNFQKSVYGSYSSPYMLKNTLSNAYVKNIDLVSNSYPVMKPVVSGSTLRWLGGNNTITGTPSNSGIAFADCYPLMDSGYNRITVNGSDYMNGNFTFAYTTVNAKINYWYDNPPQSSLFDISGGNVNYSDPFDGPTLPSTDGSEFNSIGWGMYDTVFTKSFGDNSTPEDLFMQAYTEEMSANYMDAITHYKEVVSSYKTSSYAPVSLSRIFNCLEKSHASSSDYQTIQSYYNSIKSNSAYPNESRELAEDFVIKSKVKQGNIEDAVNDYNTIYQSNQNNSKGLHALINKLCLENMVQGDNSSGNTNYQNHKIDILSLITGENIKSSNYTNNNTPKQFRLLQNYPNPFNPVTTIKYEIPNDVNVSIKIYDILGKEVFSFNEYKKAGSYDVQFDGTNLASGMYFYQLVAEGFTDTKKMVLLK